MTEHCALIPMRCPNCDERGPACACIDVRDYDDRDAADEQQQFELDERGRED
jgi:hypothetical protein